MIWRTLLLVCNHIELMIKIVFNKFVVCGF
jgi:hypothetical protein